MVTPSEFKARYENLPIQKMDGSVETVSIHKYVLNHSKWYNPAALEAFRSKYFSRGIDRDLTIFTPNGEVKVQLELTRSENRWQKKGVPMRFAMTGGLFSVSADGDARA